MSQRARVFSSLTTYGRKLTSFRLACLDDKNVVGEDEDDQVEEETSNNQKLAQVSAPTFTEMSPRFLKHCQGNSERAKKMWEEMLLWRELNRMHEVFERPLTNFYGIRRYFHQAFHGRTKNGNLVLYEQIGTLDIRGLKSLGIKDIDMAEYTAFFQEYIYTHLIHEDDGRYLCVLDIKGVSWGIISPDSLAIQKAISETIQKYFPERVLKILIVNAPEWFAGAWKFIRGLAKFNEGNVIIREEKDTLNILLEYLDDDQIPREYGGSSPFHLGDSPEEQQLWEFVGTLNNNEGVGEDDCWSNISDVMSEVEYTCGNRSRATTSDFGFDDQKFSYSNLRWLTGPQKRSLTKLKRYFARIWNSRQQEAFLKQRSSSVSLEM